MSLNIHSLDSIKDKNPPPNQGPAEGGGDGSSGDESNDDEGRQGFYVGGSDQSVGSSVYGDLDLDQFYQLISSYEEIPTPSQGASGGNMVRVHLRMYPNGFTINDGPLRDPAEPLFKELLRGNIPEDIDFRFEGRQGFYVSGSDRSGQQVLGPPSGDLASRLFEAAQRAGAETISPEEAAAMSGAASSCSNAYQGGTFRLGGHGQPSESVAVPAPSQGASGGNAARIGQKRKIEDYVPPKAKPFSGQGHRLGAVVPDIVGEGPSAADVIDLDPPAELASGQQLKKMVDAAQEGVKLAEGEPVVRVQVRIPNSEPIVARFNDVHTIMDLRAFIVSAQPSLAYRTFQLMTAYPSAVIDDDSKNLKDAGVANAVVIIEYT